MRGSRQWPVSVSLATLVALCTTLHAQDVIPVALNRGGELRMQRLSGPRADVAALILGGRESGALRTAALVTSTCAPAAGVASDRRFPAMLWVEIEGASLLDAVASEDESALPESVRIELYAYVMSRAGEIVASIAESVRIPVAALAGAVPGSGVKLSSRLELPPGDYQVRMLTREARSQRFALRVLGLAVGDPMGDELTVTLPLFADSSPTWLVAEPLDGGRPTGAPSFRRPSALPVLSPWEERTFLLGGCRLVRARIDARLTTRSGDPVPAAEIRLEPTRGEDAGELVPGRITLPELEAGLYVLEVSAESDAGQSTTTLPLFVTPGARAATENVWTAFGETRTTEPEAARESPDSTDRPGSRNRIQGLAAGYRGALEQLAAGRRGEAVILLDRLESDLVTSSGKPQRAVKLLQQSQNRVTRQLLDRDPECLLPLILLHLDVHDRYAKDGDASFHLLNATRSRVRALAQVYASDAKTKMAPALAALSLVETAAALERSGQRVSALIVLREAIALDAGNAEVLLDLAHQYEHHGFYDDAAALLRRLLEIEPRSDEGRLRLALHALRSEREEDARAILEQLVQDGSKKWTLAVAYQELAHLLLRRKRPEQAVRLLEEAVTRLPDVQRLYLELAYALDRAGRRRDAREVIARLPLDTGRPSPRLLYRVAPAEEDRRSRAVLLRHATARLPILADALAAASAPGSG